MVKICKVPHSLKFNKTINAAHLHPNHRNKGKQENGLMKYQHRHSITVYISGVLKKLVFKLNKNRWN